MRFFPKICIRKIREKNKNLIMNRFLIISRFSNVFLNTKKKSKQPAEKIIRVGIENFRKLNLKFVHKIEKKIYKRK